MPMLITSRSVGARHQGSEPWSDEMQGHPWQRRHGMDFENRYGMGFERRPQETCRNWARRTDAEMNDEPRGVGPERPQHHLRQGYHSKPVLSGPNVKGGAKDSKRKDRLRDFARVRPEHDHLRKYRPPHVFNSADVQGGAKDVKGKGRGKMRENRPTLVPCIDRLYNHDPQAKDDVVKEQSPKHTSHEAKDKLNLMERKLNAMDGTLKLVLDIVSTIQTDKKDKKGTKMDDNRVSTMENKIKQMEDMLKIVLGKVAVHDAENNKANTDKLTFIEVEIIRMEARLKNLLDRNVVNKVEKDASNGKQSKGNRSHRMPVQEDGAQEAGLACAAAELSAAMPTGERVNFQNSEPMSMWERGCFGTSDNGWDLLTPESSDDEGLEALVL